MLFINLQRIKKKITTNRCSLLLLIQVKTKLNILDFFYCNKKSIRIQKITIIFDESFASLSAPTGKIIVLAINVVNIE